MPVAIKARAKETTEEIGWTSQCSARALRFGRTGTIAFCLPPDPSGEASWLMSTDYYMELAAACASTAMDSDRRLLLARSPRDLEELASLDRDRAIESE